MTLAASFRLASLTCAAALAGCAALQIDVDVYKGPLVNEQEIQLRQFAALAIAAKPMLASVRNELEDAAGGAAANLGDDYLDDHRFRSELAHFVNGSMSYYSDLGAPDERRLLRGEAKAVDGLALFDYGALDESLADELDKGPAARTAAAVLPMDAKAGDRAFGPREFANQYHLLLCRAELGVACQKPGTAAPMTGADRKSEDFQPACLAVMGVGTCPVTPRSNSVFETLSDPDNVAKHAKALLGEGNHDRFVARIVELARGFKQARQGMLEVFEGSLTLLEAPPTEPDPNAAKVRAAIPHVLSYSMQPRTLACLLTIPETNRRAARVRDARDALPAKTRELLKAGLLDSPVDKKTGDWSIDTYEKADAAIAEAARVEPIALASFLRVTHHEAMVLPEADVGACTRLSKTDRLHVSPGAARTFGLASGPTMASSFDKAFLKLESSLLPVRAAAAVGFDRARLPDGLERLTQEFLQALDDSGHEVDAKPVREARQRLEESLIFFAERMLFVVNTVTTSAIERDIDSRPDTTNAAGAVRNDGVHRYSGTRADRVARLASRVAVLQSLGNSLVLQANDLRRQLNHSVRQEAHLQGEIDATRRALNPGAPVVFDALMLQASAQLKQQTEGAARAANAVSAAELRSTKAGQDLDDALKAEKTAADKFAERATAFKPLESLVRTYIVAADRHGVYPPNSKIDPLEGGDQKRLQKALDEAFPNDNNVEPDTYLGAIRAWLKLTASGLGDSGARFDRLNGALTYLKDPGFPLAGDALQSASRSKLETTIRDHLLDWAGDQSRQLAVLKASAAAQATAASSARAAQAKSQPKAKATAAAAAASQAATQSVASVIKILTERREDVLRDADRLNASDPASLVLLLRTSVAALATQTDETRLALTFLARFQPPPVTSYSLPPGWTGRTPTDVYDQLIAQLRHARIQAEASGFTEQSARMQRAINLAYEARSGVAFLRPASDYLKSVYSSTNLQDAVDPAQENLLDAWWKRMLPDAKGSNPYEREARQQTEKLYWQNINRVSLSGGGKTNYVIAKDDIGNWYVKAYSADPGPIIRSAQSLALFSSGQKFNVNLLNRVDIQRQLSATKDPAERDKLRADLNQNAADGNGALLKVHDRYTMQYALSLTQTAQSLDPLKQSLIPGIEKVVADAFPAEATKPDVTRLETGLTASFTEFTEAFVKVDTASKLADTDTTRLGKVEDALFNAFDALRRYRRTIYSQMSSTTGICSADLATCAKAANAAQAYVKDQLTPIVAQHRAALASYDNALFNLEDIATSK